YEVLFLLEKLKIEVYYKEEKLKFDDCLKLSKLKIEDYLVYKDLKSKGYQIKSGAKYGFAFRIYDKGIKESEDHSLWLVDIFKENKSLNFREILGKNRVAHSTNKKMIFAIFDEDNSITYLENSWRRM
ncbi:MAG: tRNA-intron lyase, partial [Nanoarchaeota archaeon]|nr:tRNA-intron lyase [Nanoarchaeota archaeon]